MIRIEIANRSGADVDEAAVADLCRQVLAREGVDEGDLGVSFEPPARMQELKRDHLGLDEATDVLSFPIDGQDELPPGVPRQLGDVVLCPRSSARRGEGRSSTACSICLATSTERRWSAESELTRNERRPDPETHARGGRRESSRA